MNTNNPVKPGILAGILIHYEDVMNLHIKCYSLPDE